MAPTPVISLTHLGLDIGGASIVADVSLDVFDGQFVAIIGPNGAGKTSLFNLVSGLYQPTAGTIALDGGDITNAAPYARARLGLGRTFQVSSLFPNLTAFENVRLAAEAKLGGTLRIWRRASRFKPALGRAHQALDRVGLTRRDSLAGALSHGDKRKLELAMILASDPRIILLDEPMAGVSAEEVDDLVDLIRTVQRDDRKTVLMVEHHMEIVTGLAEQIMVMHHGAVLAYGTPAAIMANPVVQSAYLGEEIEL